MSRKNVIERELMGLEGGAFQKLAESYVYRKLRLTSLTALGSQKGTNKVAKGIPDAHSFGDDGVCLIGFTTDQSSSYKKLEKDILDCLKIVNDPRHPVGRVAKIVCCHSCWRLKPWQEKALRDKAPGLIELLGPSTIVEDLCFEFADLASEYLGVPVGDGSLKTVSEFIAAENNRQYATPHTFKLYGRQNELDELLALIEQHRSVVTTGASGLGKTRLALEVVGLYSRRHHCESFVIDSHACADVASDARLFLHETHAVVLVDDADQLVDLRPLLNVALLNPKLKLVVTVRDYAVSTVRKAMRGYAEFAEYVVHPLPEETIAAILKEELGIVNSLYIDQICSVTKGNLRLAIMAGVQAAHGGNLAIRNACDILELFFSGLEESLDASDMFSLEQYALYGVSDLASGAPAFDNIVGSGHSAQQIVSDAQRLSRMAVLDMLASDDGRYAVRFEQQNLRDYCIYRALVYDKVISVEDYIRNTIGVQPDALVTALNCLLGIFASEETSELIKGGAQSYWLSLGSEDGAARERAMSMLHPLLEPYDLEYARMAIDGMKPGDMVTGKEYRGATTGLASLPMQIACRTK